MSIDREERRVNEDDDSAETVTTRPEPPAEASNFLGRQWETVKRLHGWRRPIGVVAIGAEVLLLAAVVVVVIII
jgi:negative regulator of sigma E activity